MSLSEKIKKDVGDQISDDSRVDASKVKVEVDLGGKVILSGTVPDYFAKRAAADDAWSVIGVTGVDNMLTVKYSTEELVPDDNELETNIKFTLQVNPVLENERISVSVENGIVTLEGSVDHYWQLYRAEELTWDQRGVLGVNNKLAVVPKKIVSDEIITEKIKNFLDRSVLVESEMINVGVADGEVTLSGTVPGYSAFNSVHHAVIYTAGVKKMVNNLEII